MRLIVEWDWPQWRRRDAYTAAISTAWRYQNAAWALVLCGMYCQGAARSNQSTPNEDDMILSFVVMESTVAHSTMAAYKFPLVKFNSGAARPPRRPPLVTIARRHCTDVGDDDRCEWAEVKICEVIDRRFGAEKVALFLTKNWPKSKIGDHHATYYWKVRGVTIADLRVGEL